MELILQHQVIQILLQNALFFMGILKIRIVNADDFSKENLESLFG